LAGEAAGEGIVVAEAAAGDLVGERRIGLTVDLGLGVGSSRDRTLGDGQVGADESEVVVAVQRQGALLDGVGADVLTGLAGEAAGDGVVVGEAAVGDLVGERRIGLTVDLGLGIGG